MFKGLKNWYKSLTDKYTVAHDVSPFWNVLNQREELEHVIGLWRAEMFCRNWVLKHPMGQARIIKGWLYWPDQNKKEE